MFDVYDIETNELIFTGSTRAIGKKFHCAISSVSRAADHDYIIKKKYRIKRNGVRRHTVVNLYDVYDLRNNNKKIIECKRAKDIAKELYFSLSRVYSCIIYHEPICDGRYMIVKVCDREELKHGINT